MNNSDGPSATLLTNEVEGEEVQTVQKKTKYTLFLGVGIIVVVALIILIVILTNTLNKDVVPPTSIKLPLLEDRSTIMKVGTSRVLEVLFFSGSDDRTSDDFKSVTEREVHWKVDPQGIISVDSYGRVEALAVGTAKIKVNSLYVNSVSDSKTIEVIQRTNITVSKSIRKIDFAGDPVKIPLNYQKVIKRYSKSQVAVSSLIPQSIKDVSANPETSAKKTTIIEGSVTWEIQPYADKSPHHYLKRTDSNGTDRDKIQYFIGDRYLPGNGLNIISIESDNSHGIWTVEENGTVTNIKMVVMTSNEKAEVMVADTEKYVMRHGFASDAQWNGKVWKPSISDNDGLWTGMFDAGEFMKYAVMRKNKAPDADIQLARARAIRSLKAVLMNAYVSGRNGTVDAKMRRFNSSRNQVYLSKDYLKKDKVFQIDNYPGSPADGVGFFGENAGTVIDGAFEGGSQKYTYRPLNPDDWTTTQEPATSKRTLNNYLARSFVIPALEVNFSRGGLFFQRNENGTQTVISGADNLYDYTVDDHPVLDLGNLELPQILTTIQTIDGRPLKSSDMVYKGDTSTDSLIGDIFLFKIAFDVLDQSDQEEDQLKLLIAETVAGIAQMFVNNGYCQVDATGQGTKWTRMTRDFFNSDYTLEDSPLKAIQTLLIFKLAYYMTNDVQWKNEYQLLVFHPSFKYADLVSTLWDRWVWRAFNEDPSPKDSFYRLNFTKDEIGDTELIRHVMYSEHYSDDEEALLAYYLIFQLEEDQQLLARYKMGLEGYWKAIKMGENPLWYLIYQLSEPNNSKTTDYFGNNVREVSAWALSRHPIDTVTYTAFVQGSRPDVIFERTLSVDPSKKIGSRKSLQDAIFVNVTKNYQVSKDFDPMTIYSIHPLPQDQRSLHKYNGASFANIDRGSPNNRQAATLFTLPYWLGVYHNMIVQDV